MFAAKQTIAALGVAGLLAACSSEGSQPDISELEQGLNVIDSSDPQWGLATAFVQGDNVVYFESRVGLTKPEVYRIVAPNEPQHEMDFRFVDRNGIIFYSQRGGDDFVDPTWAAEINEQKAASKLYETSAEADANFRLAQLAVAAMNERLPRHFRDHLFDAQAVLTAELPSQRVKTLAPAAGQGEEAYFNWHSTGTGQWLRTKLYAGDSGCALWVCAAEHSATLMMKGPPSSTYVTYYNACNHGRCYNGSGMGYKCHTGDTWTSNSTWMTGETNHGANVAVSGGCATPYNWHSGGYDHLCNSDSSYEMWQSESGGYQTARGDHYSFTWDSNGNNYACNCNNNNDCDGDWGRPACP